MVLGRIVCIVCTVNLPGCGPAGLLYPSALGRWCGLPQRSDTAALAARVSLVGRSQAVLKGSPGEPRRAAAKRQSGHRGKLWLCADSNLPAIQHVQIYLYTWYPLRRQIGGPNDPQQCTPRRSLVEDLLRCRNKYVNGRGRRPSV